MELLDFLTSIKDSKVHAVAEGHDEETIDLIVEVLGATMSESTLWEMTDEEIEALERKANRVKYCNTQWVYVLRGTADLKAMPRLCGNWRVCEFCHNGRILDLKNQALRALLEERDRGNNTLNMIAGTIAEIYPIRAGLAKKNYFSLPQANNDVVLFTVDGPGVSLTYDEIDTLDWDSMVMTPIGRRVSGALGKLKEEDDDKVSIKSYSITAQDEHHVNALPEHVRQAYLEAYQEVVTNVAPKNIQALQDCLLELALKFRDNLKRIGKENDRNYTVRVHDWNIRENLDCMSFWGIRANFSGEIPTGTPDVPFG